MTVAKTKPAADEPEKKQEKQEKKEDKGLVAQLRSIGPAVAVALVIRAFLFEPFSIPSGSMLPTLEIGDYVIVTKFAYGVRIPFTNRMLWQRDVPERGDVIVFDHPLRGEDLIKRVVGLPGDEITLLDGVVHVNGKPQARTLVSESHPVDDLVEPSRKWVTLHGALYVEELVDPEAGVARHHVLQQRPVEPPEGPYKVPPGTVFVLGDNRDNSADSRSYGTWYVPLGHIRGRADVIGFSWGRTFRTDRLFRPLDQGVVAP